MRRAALLDRLNRRSVIITAGAATVGAGLDGNKLVQSSDSWQRDGLTVTQGNECAAVDALEGPDDIVDLYGYSGNLDVENPRQANLPSQLEEAGTSRVFFYDGPEGLSLVFLQGGNDDPGGAASFLVCGLPSEGVWVVLDDSYDGATDEFLLGDHEALLHWAWGVAGRNDGAVFRGFPGKFCVTIKPVYGEAARFESFGDGNVEDWQFLSGDIEDPDVIDLEMGEPITLSSGSCDEGTERCTMRTETVEEPFDATITFCCTAAMIDAEAYDSVWINLLDGTEQRFEGPFGGVQSFLAEYDDDGNPNDEIIRSVTIEADADTLTVRNPNFDRCRETMTSDDGDDEIAY